MTAIIENTASVSSFTAPAPDAPWKVDFTKGQSDMTVSNEWYKRTPDQRFDDMYSLHAQVSEWAGASTETAGVRIGAVRAHADQSTGLIIDINGMPTQPTNYGFGGLCRRVGAPPSFITKLSPQLAADVLNERIGVHADDTFMSYTMESDNGAKLRALTSDQYGRIYDYQVAEALIEMVGDGVGETQWKVPGIMDWSTGKYNPYVDVNNETTTLFASDRDLFCFFVDDTHPIEVGKLADGSPDLMFRGFYVRNSEVGECVLEITTMMLRSVCANRILWGVEGTKSLRIRHSSNAPDRFISEIRPALEAYSQGSVAGIVEAVEKAKSAKLDTDKDRQVKFLTEKLGFSQTKANEILSTVLLEEGKPADSLWDITQGITAMARKIQFQDKRVELEQVGAKVMEMAQR